MSPILLRPVREQLQHDRVIQALLARWRRRFEVAANLGSDEPTTVKAAGTVVSPDLVFWASKGPRRLEGIVEVETAESVNHLEAMAEWANFGKVRAPFYLYVPAGAADVAQRLCVAHEIRFAEIWTYHAVGDTLRFTMVHRRSARQARRSRAAASRPGAVAPARARTATRTKTAATKSAVRKASRKTSETSTRGAGRKSSVKKAAARPSRGTAKKRAAATTAHRSGTRASRRK